MAAVNGLAMYDKKTLLDAQINIEDYAPLVKRIAYHMMMRMPASVQVDDLIQAGMIGLIEASQKYDMSRGASFETYAGIRIRGAIVDEMRRGDWVPRSVHRNARRVSQAIAAVEARTGRDATDGEVAAELGVSLDEYFVMLQDSSSARLFSYEETFGEEDSNIDASEHSSAFVSPLEGMQRDGLKKALFDAICQLPEREQMVLSLYYDQELNLKEIGLVLGVSESRVSQIHSQAAARLRTKLSDWHTG
ncbi:RNA polymerase sigma factor FliA [Cellvibrio sp. KY-GH-1]|nr:RNA polymerase sigma factor FliA [Cellvibrio sp. KY-GH-1]QEY15196.1 RNA polymerase sigma factor FliA [Cellvibrio sp. KY-GH-1]